MKYLAFVFLCFTFDAFAVPEKDTGNLGEIRQSILSETDFQRIYGDGWVLMDGRDITNTDLIKEKLWSGSNLPDARGVFLRSMNAGRSSTSGNPDGDVPICHYQGDQICKHQHHVPSGKYHPNSNSVYGSDGDTYRAGDQGYGGPQYTSEVGGAETRPRNISVYTYIKVNRTPEDLYTKAILDAVAEVPKKVAGNSDLSNLIRRTVQQELKNQGAGQLNRKGL